MNVYELIIGLAMGVGLSAACGFRVFIPLLGISIASLGGHITLSSGFEWLGSWPALLAFATAACLEIGAYYVPWLDNILDTIEAPAAVVAGTIITASMVGDMSPFLRWTLALIAGGGVAGVVELGTVATRGVSSITTGGTANFLVSSGELLMSIIATLLAVVVPLLALALAAALVAAAALVLRKRHRGRRLKKAASRQVVLNQAG